LEPDVESFRRYRDELTPGGVPAPSRPWLPAIGVLGCAAAVLVGSFGPWVITREDGVLETVHGVETDGVLSLVGAVVAIVALFVVVARPGVEAAA
jgi:hypothetical protein